MLWKLWNKFFCCCGGWLVVRRGAILVRLCVYQVSVCNAYVERFGSDEVARNMLCGVACGWKVEVCLLDCLCRFLVAFFERVCGYFCVTRWNWGCDMLVGLEVCVVVGVCVEARDIFF